MRTLIAVVALLLTACSTVAPGGATPGATPAPTAAPPTAAAATPAPGITTAPATPPAAITPGPGYSCDPMDYECEPKYTPRPSSAAATPEPVGEQLVVNRSVDGTYLVDEAGMSLYVFDNDSELQSDCTSGNCLENWPPLLLAPDVVAVGGDGVTGDLASFERTGGGTQVAYNGAPLYYFAGDAAPGDKNGDGVNDVWHLAAP